jgi:hypothetical protein
LGYCLFAFWNKITHVAALCFLPEQRPGAPADDHNNHQGEERVQIEPVQFKIGLILKIVFTEVHIRETLPS